MKILSRRAPFHQYNRDAQVIAALQRRELPKRPEQEGNESDEIDDRMWNLMMDCWDHTPQRRPELEEIHKRVIYHWGSQDTRSNRAERSESDAPAFRKAVRTESEVDIDLERVYQALRRVSDVAEPDGQELTLALQIQDKPTTG